MIDFFISYSRRDKGFAQKFVEELTRHQWATWIDETGIAPSVPWMNEIQHAIRSSMMVVVIDSSEWRRSETCQIELQLAEQNVVPVVRVEPSLERMNDMLELVVDEYRALPHSRPVALDAAASAAIWAEKGRKKSLLVRGRSLTVLKRALRRDPEYFSPTAVSFVKASRRASHRRWVAGLALGLATVLLIGGIVGSKAITKTAEELSAKKIAAATHTAELNFYSDWNVYAGIERMPGDGSMTYAEYSQFFSFLSQRLPIDWDSEPVTATGQTSAVSPDGAINALVDDSAVRLTLEDGTRRTIPTSSHAASLAWSPDSRWIAVATVSGAEILAVENGASVPLRGGVDDNRVVEWIDGSHVSVGGRAGTGTWKVFDGAVRAKLGQVKYSASSGSRMYSVNDRGVLTATDIESGAHHTIPTELPDGAQFVGIDANHDTVVLAVSGSTPSLIIVDPEVETSRIIPISECSPLALSLMADGDSAYLACIEIESNQTRVDLKSGAVSSRPAPKQHLYGVRALGDRVLWGGINGGVFKSELDLTSVDQLDISAGCGAPTRKFVGLPDGARLFPIGDATGSFGCASRISTSSDGKVQTNRLVFDSSDGHAAPDAATSPDGSLIAYALSDGRVRVFTSDGLTPVYYAQVAPSQLRAVTFSPDGDELLVASSDGVISAIQMTFESVEKSAKAMVDDASQRLLDAVDWGIYKSTLDPNEGKR